MSAGATYKAALVSALTTAFAADESVLVSYGDPGDVDIPDIVAVLGLSSEQSAGPMGPARSREEVLTATVVVSSFVGGGPDVQQAATERSFAVLSTIKTTLRDNCSLGGVVRSCEVAMYDQDESVAYMKDVYGGDPVAIGQLSTLVVQIRAAVRI